MTELPTNQLRRGNIVRFTGIGNKGDGDWCRISHVPDTDTVTGVEGFPLTPEILEKAGFKGRDEGFYNFYSIEYTRVLVKCKFELQYLDENMLGWIEGNTIVHLYHLHQLQNLYFALTGEELNIKL